MTPRMIVVGGPPGSGKSTALPVSSFGIDAFNIDDRCRELHGSYRGIPHDVRMAASAECERFVHKHIHAGKSFAVETTMRTPIAIDQARAARANGFMTILFYFCTDDPAIHVQRVAARSHGGGHAAPEGEIRATYSASLANLHQAIRTFDFVECFDTTTHDAPARRLATTRSGKVILQSEPALGWLNLALESLYTHPRS